MSNRDHDDAWRRETWRRENQPRDQQRDHDDPRRTDHPGGAEHGYGQGGRTAYGQMTTGGSDTAGGGFGSASTGASGGAGLNSQWGQGGMGPMTQGANYSQGGGAFGPAGHDSWTQHSSFGSRDDPGRYDHTSQARQDEPPYGDRSYGDRPFDAGRGASGASYGQGQQTGGASGSGQAPYGSGPQAGYGQPQGGFGQAEHRGGGRDDRDLRPGGPRHDPDPRSTYALGGGSYGQQDFSEAARRSEHRDDQRYGQAGREAFGTGRERDFGAGAEERHDHEPHYRQWRDSQLSSHDRDYSRWRDEQARKYDEDYSKWRNERHSTFSKSFEGWRSNRGGPTGAGPTNTGPGVEPDARTVAGVAPASEATPLTTGVASPGATAYGDTASPRTTADDGKPDAYDPVNANLVHGANPMLGDIADGGTGGHPDHHPHDKTEEERREDAAR